MKPRSATAARGWVRLIPDRHRDLISDRPNRATAAEAPLDETQERYGATTSTTPQHTHVAHINTAKQHSALALPYTFFAYE